MAKYTTKHSGLNQTIICAHRGGGADPESLDDLVPQAVQAKLAKTLGKEPDHYELRDEWANRLHTFEYMMEKGMRHFELDLMLSKDGDIMVVHNSEMDGKNVWEYKTKELEDKGCLKLDDLLTATEKFQRASGEKVTLYLEAKGSVSSEDTTDAGKDILSKESKGLATKLATMIKSHVEAHHDCWDYDQLPVIGFNHQILALTKSHNGEIKTGLSYAREHFDVEQDDMRTVTQRPDFKTAFIDRMISEAQHAGARFINIDEQFVNQDLIKTAHENNIKVFAWRGKLTPSPSSQDMVRMDQEIIDKGADLIFSDLPLAAKRLLIQKQTSKGNSEIGSR